MATGNVSTTAFIPNQLIAAPGTRIIFNMASAPLGWTQDVTATFNDAALRLVTSAGGGTGGSTALSNWISGGTFNINTFTLSVAQMPTHNHSVSDPGHVHGITAVLPNSANSGNNVTGTPSSGGNMSTDSAGSNITINNNGSGAGITPNYTTPSVKYTDCIVGIKS